MKPEDLLRAMESIPEEYISEAKPERRGESSRKTQKAAASAAMQTANGHSGSIAQHCSGRQRKDSNMSRNTKQPVWQRVTTGIVAAAACTVFIGGGLFIAQQAKQNQPDAAAGGATNFLGGKGEIHVAFSKDYPLHTLDLMYDDTSVYFDCGKYAADRTGGRISKAYQTSASVQETLSHTLWDGEQFYYQNGSSLYTMDMTGDWGAGEAQLEPFYHINRNYIGLDVPEADVTITNVQKLRENDYVISLSAAGKDADGNEMWAGSSVLHHPQGYRIEEDNQAFPPEIVPGVPGQLLPVQDDLAAVQTGINGRFRTVNLTPAGLNPVSSAPVKLLGDSEIVQPAEYGTAWTVHDNSIYYMSEIIATNVDYEASHFCAIDIELESVTDFGEADFRSFIPCGDEMLYVTTDGKGLYSSDFTRSELAIQQLAAFDDSVPEEIQALVPKKWDAAPLKSLDAADENYALMALDSEAEPAYALFDRSTGEMRWFTISTEAAPDAEDGRNLLGGYGDLHLSDDTMLMFDDTKVYFTNGAYCADLFGGEFTKRMKTEEVQDLSAYRDYHIQAVHALQPKYAGQLYARKGCSLYHADSLGHLEDAPFYTVSDKDIAKLNNNLGEGWELEHYAVTKLNDDYLIIDLYAVNKEKTISTSLSYLFRPETGEQTEMPECVTGYYLADGGNCYAFSKNGDLYTIEMETGRTAKTFLSTHPINVFGVMALENGYLYYMSDIGGNGEQYMKLDLKTHAYTELLDVSGYGNKECIAYDGMIYGLSADCSRIECFAPAKPDARICIYDFEKTAPETVRESVQAARKQNSRIHYDIRSILSVSEAYLTAELADQQILLLDRKTGEVRYFSEDYAEHTALHTQPPREDTQNTVTESNFILPFNIFGGNGQIQPVYQNDAGICGLYRDNEYYYCMKSDDYGGSAWQRCPLGGGTWELVPERKMDNIADVPEGTVFFPHNGTLLTDGERVYNSRLAVITAAGAEPFFDFENAFSDKRDIDGIEAVGIWHLQNRYFALFRCYDNQRDAETFWRVWLDEDGVLIGGTGFSDTEQDAYAYFCDAEHEAMYYIEDGKIHTLPAPGQDVQYTAPDTDMPIMKAFISGGKTVFVTEGFDLMLADEDGNVVQEPIDVNVYPDQAPKLTPDGMLVYSRMTDEHSLICIMPRFAQGDYGPFLAKMPTDDDGVYLCGLTENGEIVAADTDTGEYCIMEYDADAGKLKTTKIF